ncbi:MAG: hypothetical protein H0U98_17335, partial [Alphaproteobacteria bacterium]|nr:hypothetical protein [Alphaproteobacteria bacterium]
MIPWIHLDTATVPGGGGALKLMRRGDEFAIVAGGGTLMNSRASGSEEALATLTCDRLKGRRNCSLLIGGYGMGFTLRAVLGAVGPDADIVVSEIVPEIIDWARGPMAHFTASCLADPRVTLRIGDVAREIEEGGYDAILLDVDNGPDGLSRDLNDGLY